MRRVLTSIAVCFAAALSLFASQAPFPHVGVVAIAIKDGKILLTKHTSAKGKINWTPPTCHLKLGERPSSCALKAFTSQTGIVARDAKRVHWLSEVFDPLDSHTITLLVEIDDFDETTIQDGEWIELNTLSKDQLALIKQISIDQNAHIS